MGSVITLSLGSLEIDWGKNSIGLDHSPLFIADDRKEVDYYYADEVVERKPALARTLESTIDRLELLGYTLADCRRIYEDTRSSVTEEDGLPPMSFDEFAHAIRCVNVSAVRLPEHEDDYDLGEFSAKAILADPEFVKTDKSLGTLNRQDGVFYENLDPYIILRLLAENKANLNLDVIWRFSDVVAGGWVDPEYVHRGVSEKDMILVVTEGSTDGAILKSSLSIVMPHVADFFTFVDMSDNYPFTGTGNLVRFCQGLARIKIQNRILVVLDNDTAGQDAFARIKELILPLRMRVTVLPDLEECRRIRTLGPSGHQIEDINGKAVSIEWFLNTELPGRSGPVVRWTSYNPNRDAYQGELVSKDAYTKQFFGQISQTGYAWPKLERLWRHLLRECTVPYSL